MSRKANPNPEPRVTKTTRIPARLRAYLKSLANLQYGTLNNMQIAMLRGFLTEKPWVHYGLAWRTTRATSDKSEDAAGLRATGWEQVNFFLPPSLAEEIEMVAEIEDVNVSVVLYTACYWWAWFVYPPQQEVDRRRRMNQPEQLSLSAEASAAEEDALQQLNAEHRRTSHAKRQSRAEIPSGEPRQESAAPDAPGPFSKSTPPPPPPRRRSQGEAPKQRSAPTSVSSRKSTPAQTKTGSKQSAKPATSRKAEPRQSTKPPPSKGTRRKS